MFAVKPFVYVSPRKLQQIAQELLSGYYGIGLSLRTSRQINLKAN